MSNKPNWTKDLVDEKKQNSNGQDLSLLLKPIKRRAQFYVWIELSIKQIIYIF